MRKGGEAVGGSRKPMTGAEDEISVEEVRRGRMSSMVREWGMSEEKKGAVRGTAGWTIERSRARNRMLELMMVR